MISEDFKNKIHTILFRMADVLRQTHRFDFEIIPVFLTLLRHHPNNLQVYSTRDSNRSAKVYELLYHGIAEENETLIKAYSSFVAAFDDTAKGIDLIGSLLYNFEPLQINSLSQEEFVYAFETALEYSEKSDRGLSFGLPKELSMLLTQTYQLDQPLKVYNPYAGFCNIANYLPENAFYYGEEIDIRTWAMGIINLFAHNRLNHSYFINANSLETNPISNYDICVASPPLNSKVRFEGDVDYWNHESAIITKVLGNFQDDKKAAVLVSPNFLTSEYTQVKALRKELIDKNLLEYVILLPPKLLSKTSIPLVAIFLNASQRESGTNFVDASSFVISKDKKNKILDLNRLLQTINERISPDKKWISSTRIRQEEYNLSVKRYVYTLSDLVQDLPTVKLFEIASERPREIFKGSAHAPFIRVRDLKTDFIDSFLSSSNVQPDHIPPQAYEVRAASLLLALRFGNLKPTVLNFSDSHRLVFVSTDILTLKVDDKVDIQYLIIELNSEFVQKQVESYSYGTTITSIKKKDVLNLKIRLPDKQTQRKIVTEKFEEFYLKKDAELRSLKSQFNINDDAFQVVATLKHSLGRPMININAGILHLEELIKNSKDKDLKQQILRITSAVKQNLQVTDSILEHNENELNLSRFELKEMELLSFLLEYINSPAEYSFFPTMNVSNEIFQELTAKIYINSNPELLLILFNNILDNAHRHAFKGVKTQRNILAIYLEIASEKSPPSVIISVANNGEPFPENFDQDKFIKRNSKAGPTGNTGLGGYDINRIVNYLGGVFHLRLNEDPDFSTMYEIEFPILNTRENDDEEV